MILQTPSILPLSSLITLISVMRQRKHFLMALLSLEAFSLSIILMIITTSSKVSPLNTIIILITLSFAAVEASLGLACLVSLIRTKGKDLLPPSTTFSC